MSISATLVPFSAASPSTLRHQRRHHCVMWPYDSQPSDMSTENGNPVNSASGVVAGPAGGGTDFAEAVFHMMATNGNRRGSYRGASPPPQPPPSACSSSAASRASLGGSSSSSMGSGYTPASSSSVDSASNSPRDGRYAPPILPLLTVPPPSLGHKTPKGGANSKNRDLDHLSSPSDLPTQRQHNRLSSLLNSRNGGEEQEPITMPVMPRIDHIQSLEAVLRKQGSYETEKGLDQRREVLKELNCLVRQWIQSVSLKKGMHWQDIDKLGGRIVTYGSYMLGISHRGADIDALCIAPQHITREDYFTSFFNMLQFQQEVNELRSIQEAYVPVIKMKYNGIEIDMTFARLNVPEIPPACGDDIDVFTDPFLPSVRDLNLLDPKCVRSLNGYRSTLELKSLVPNIEVFRLTLRSVKLWAKSQGLYSNILGYLGGFSWAVLVAKICMMNPNDNAVEILQKFFHLFANWNWPQPVTLVDIRKQSYEPSNGNNVYPFHSLTNTSWNPDHNVHERFQVMPIITPTFPHLNSSFNVSANTKKLIQKKMLVAAGTCDKIVEGKDSWDALFKTCHMFHEYEHFLVLMASASKHLMWFGLIESKIRHLVNSIEKDCSPTVSSARIWPKPYMQTKKTETSITAKQLWFIGLEFGSSVTQDFKRVLNNFELQLRQQARTYITSDMRIEGHFVLKSELTSLLTPSEIQGIVSSQSQKKSNTCTIMTPAVTASLTAAPTADHHRHFTSSTPHHHQDDGHGHPSYINSYANATKMLGDKRQKLPNVTGLLPTIPQHHGFLGSPVSSISNGSLTAGGQLDSLSHFGMQSPLGLPTQPPKAPIMEGTWVTSPQNRRSGANRHKKGHSPCSSGNSPHDGASAELMNLIGKNEGPAMGGRCHMMSLGSERSIDEAEMSPNSSVHHQRGGSSSSARGQSRCSNSSGSCSSTSCIDDGSYSSLESDHGRSVSFSSDKFPPSALVHARIHHSDNMPNFSVPPPLMTTPTTQNSEPVSAVRPHSRSPKDLKLGKASGNSSQQRLSSGEIIDVPTPTPIQTVQFTPMRFNFQASSLQQFQAASDSVFH